MANTIIRLKNSGASGNTPGTLQPGELAINYADGKLYYGNQTNNAVLFDAITEPAGLNQELQFNDSGVFGSSAKLKFDSTNSELSVNAKISVTASSGEEGGEIFLARPQSNTTLNGGVTIDVYRNRIRFFEQGGSARGAYIDLTQANTGADSNLLTGGAGGTLDPIARDVAGSAFGQANLAYDKANVGSNLASSAFDQANAATNLAQSAYNYANTITSVGVSPTSDYPFPTGSYGFVTENFVALVSDNTFMEGEISGTFYDCRNDPTIPTGFYLRKDLGFLA
jgi:hypothetical protein